MLYITIDDFMKETKVNMLLETIPGSVRSRFQYYGTSPPDPMRITRETNCFIRKRLSWSDENLNKTCYSNCTLSPRIWPWIKMCPLGDVPGERVKRDTPSGTRQELTMRTKTYCTCTPAMQAATCSPYILSHSCYLCDPRPRRRSRFPAQGFALHRKLIQEARKKLRSPRAWPELRPAPLHLSSPLAISGTAQKPDHTHQSKVSDPPASGLSRPVQAPCAYRSLRSLPPVLECVHALAHRIYAA